MAARGHSLTVLLLVEGEQYSISDPRVPECAAGQCDLFTLVLWEGE